MGLGQLSDRERAEFFAELDDWLAEIGRSVHALVGPDLLTVANRIVGPAHGGAAACGGAGDDLLGVPQVR